MLLALLPAVDPACAAPQIVSRTHTNALHYTTLTDQPFPFAHTRGRGDDLPLPPPPPRPDRRDASSIALIYRSLLAPPATPHYSPYNT